MMYSSYDPRGINQAESVPGPYHAVARTEDEDAALVENALRDQVIRNLFSDLELAAICRILDARKSELHVSGAPDRVYTNDSTVRLAVEALNRCTGQK